MTTCQICERPIAAKSGVIAHHGYRRPYHRHYQTKSCFGARHEPYEQSNGALPLYIEMLQDWWDRSAKYLDALESNPGPMKYRPNPYANDTIEVSRPADFDPKNAEPDYRMHSYVTLYLRAVRETKNELSYLSDEIARAEARLAAWVAP